MSDKEILQKYAEIKQKISAYEEEADLLRGDVMDAIQRINPTDGIVESEFGSFVIVQKRKYEYSDTIKDIENNLKQAKKEAEAKGEATYVVQPYLKFTKNDQEI